MPWKLCFLSRREPLDLSTCFLVPGWKPRGTYKISIVRQSISQCVSHGLSQKPLQGFFRNLARFGGKICKKRSTAAFLRFLLVFSKNAHLCEKKHFWQFLRLCGKSVPRIFLKLCQNVSKNSSFRLEKFYISEILGEVIYKQLTSTTQIFFWHNHTFWGFLDPRKPMKTRKN